MAEDKKTITGAEMDALFVALREKEQDEAVPESRAFLNSLASIPDRHPQTETPVSASMGGWSLGALIERWFSPEQLLSARGLATQTAFASLLLVSGIAAGLEATEEPQAFEDYDISASLFGDESVEYSIDG